MIQDIEHSDDIDYVNAHSNTGTPRGNEQSDIVGDCNIIEQQSLQQYIYVYP